MILGHFDVTQYLHPTSGKNSTSGENRHGDTRTVSTATPTLATSDQLTNPAATINEPLQTTPTVTLDPTATFDPSVTSLETQPPVPLTTEGLSVETAQLTSARKTSTKPLSTLASVTSTPERELGTEYEGSGTEFLTTEHLTERMSQTSETSSSVASLSIQLAADQLSVITTLETPNEKSTSTASVIATSAEKLESQFEGSGSEVPTTDNSSTRATILSSDVPTRSDTFLSTPVTTKEPSVTTSLNGMLTSAQTSVTSEEKPEMEFEGSGTDRPTTSELFSRDTVKMPTAQVPTTKESFVIRTQDPSLEETPTTTLASMTETLAGTFELNFEGSGNDNPAIIELLEEKTTESPEVPQASVAYIGTTLIPVVDEDFNEPPQSQEKKSAAFTFSNFHRRSNSEDSTKTRSHRNAVESNKKIKRDDAQHTEVSSTDITGPPQLPTAALLKRPTQLSMMHPTRTSASSLPLDTTPSSFHSEIEGSGATQGSGMSEATSASFISTVTQRSTPSINSEGSGSPATSRQVGRPNFLETTPTGMKLHGKTLEGASETNYAVTSSAANEEPSKRKKCALSDVEILEEHDGSNLMDNLGQNKQDSNPPKNKDKTVSSVVDDDTGAKFLEILDEQ